MPEIVGVRFKRAGKVYYFDPANIALKVYDYVVVQTARGVELGQVTIEPKQVLASEITTELKSIVRKATPDDVRQAQDFATKEENALTECTKIIAKHKLPMKLVSAEYNLDGSRLTFYFTSDERVDFRELVRDLTAYFKTRIELRQIGPRDQAKIVAGMGRCGRSLCCCTFLTEFNPVSIKMAKEQDLPLDPMKISGVCGRLQCCLAYESNQYREAKAQMPHKGQPVSTPSGNGIVIGVFPLKETVLVEFESQANAEFPLDQITLREGVPVSSGESPAETEPVAGVAVEDVPSTEAVEGMEKKPKFESQPKPRQPDFRKRPQGKESKEEPKPEQTAPENPEVNSPAEDKAETTAEPLPSIAPEASLPAPTEETAPAEPATDTVSNAPVEAPVEEKAPAEAPAEEPVKTITEPVEIRPEELPPAPPEKPAANDSDQTQP